VEYRSSIADFIFEQGLLTRIQLNANARHRNNMLGICPSFLFVRYPHWPLLPSAQPNRAAGG
jgi:hypothetical protein